MTDISQPDALRRRAFLVYCGSLGLGSTLFPGALWAQSDGGQEAITPEMIDHVVEHRIGHRRGPSNGRDTSGAPH